MKKTENECVDCNLYCIGNDCPFRNVTRYYCDECGSEAKLYHYDDKELCEECLLEKFEIVEGSDW